jgi:acetoacetyl-CoA synthetase
VQVKTTSSMVDALTALWQRLLQRSPIGLEENFFDLGGDSSLAVELFNEVSKVCGRDLPAVMIYQTPTIAALAKVLEQSAVLRLPPLVQLRPGTDQAPVFIAHGLGGSAMDFFQPVRFLKTLRPVYGMQAKGFEGAEEPLDRIEDMAEYFLKAVRKIQPRGPYFLVGFSLGGLITMEMAQRLLESGEKIALLAMLDAYPHRNFLSAGQRARLTALQTGRRVSKLFQGIAPPPNQNDGEKIEPEVSVTTTPAMLRVRECAHLALERYQPRFYNGKIKFAKAAISYEFPDDPASVWSPLAAQFEMETVPGDHLAIITTHYENLAAVLTRFLQDASVS